MAKAELNISTREGLGKGGARSLRRQGQVPGVVYGRGMEACAVSVDPKALQKAVATEAGWNTLITLKGNGPFDRKTVILKDMQVDSIRGDIMHVDFHAIDLKEKVHVMVPVHPIGKSEGEKAGGNLQVIRHEREVVCLPNAIPSSIDVDVAGLNIGDTIHVEDLVLPKGIEIPHEVNFTVITVTGRKAEEEAAAEGEAVQA